MGRDERRLIVNYEEHGGRKKRTALGTHARSRFILRMFFLASNSFKYSLSLSWNPHIRAHGLRKKNESGE